MRAKVLMIILCIFLISACAAKKQVVVPIEPVEPCPLPTGYQLRPAIETARQSLSTCPEKLDPVFMALLDIATHSPAKENSVLIQDLLKDLISENKISETYTKTLYQKYFSLRFVSIPDTKIYNLPGQLDSIKNVLKAELACKKIGMVACCNDKESYKLAETEYARASGFMENLVYNEEYLKGSM